jgi:ankyrin repeat protein
VRAVALSAVLWLVAPAAPLRAEGRPPPETAPAPDPSPVGAATGRNRAMGTGEPLDPQPFTREQRLLQAVREGDRATVERALALGVSVHARDDLGRSALLLAVRDAGSLELVRFLHERGARVDEPDAAGRTPLSFAAGKGRLEIARYLVEQGAEPDRADEQGRTPLFHAVFGGHGDLVGFLLAQGVRVDVRDRFRDTPLMAACAKGYGGIAERLLASGADPTLRDQEGRTARERAAPGTEACLRQDPVSASAP